MGYEFIESHNAKIPESPICVLNKFLSAPFQPGGQEVKGDQAGIEVKSGPVIDLSAYNDRLGLFDRNLFGKEINLSASPWVKGFVSDPATGQNNDDIVISIQGTKDNFENYLSAWRKRLYSSH